jgi:hypothetical protein
MSTNFESIRADVQAFFNTGWGTRTPIQWEQVAYEPTAGTPYVTLWVNSKEAIPSGMGSSKPYRAFGVVQVDINCPVNTGIKTMTGHADAVATIFLGKQTTSGVTFRNMKIHKTVIGVWQRWCLSFNFHKDILA